MAEELMPEEGMARNYAEELTELKEEFEKLQEHLSNVEVRYQTEIQETNKQKENNFADRLMSVVTNLFGRSQYSDLKIQLENGNKLCVHKLVLLSRSDDWGVTDLDEVEVLDLKGIKYDVAYSMLKWVYTDQIEFEENEENLVEMLKLSTKYNLQPLQIRCQNFMIEIVNVDNCNIFNQAASETSAELLKDYCQEFLSKHQDEFPVLYDDNSNDMVINFEDSENSQGSQVAKAKKVRKKRILKNYLEGNEEEGYKICIICRKSLHDPEELNLHAHESLTVDIHDCIICGQRSLSVSRVRKCYMTSGECNIICRVCLRTDIIRNTVVDSCKLPYNCGKCKKEFSCKGHLKDHIHTHTGLKPFQCEFCGRGFTAQQSLHRHKLHHAGKKSFRCVECDRQFFTGAHLRRHVRTHSGEKPFQCNECGKCFAQTNTLQAHIRTHSGAKPYVCDQCDKSFTERRSLQNHQNKIHGIPLNKHVGLLLT